MLAVSARHHCYWWGYRDSIVVGERITPELLLASAVVGGVGGIVIVVVGRVALSSAAGLRWHHWWGSNGIIGALLSVGFLF